MKETLSRKQLKEVLKLASQLQKEQELDKEAALNEAYRRLEK